jgi:hypothetical protein
MSTSTEITLSNGSRIVVDRPAFPTPVLRLIWERGEQPAGEPKRNCELSPDDLVKLMSLLARDARRVFGDGVAHGIEIAVRGAVRTPQS